MSKSTHVTCPFCRKTFALDAWKAPLPRLLQPFTETASPIATATLVTLGRELQMWKSYPAGHRRLVQLEEEGFIIRLDQGWWTITEEGKTLGKSCPSESQIDLGLYLNPPPPPEVVEQSEIIPIPTKELLYFLREFVDFPVFSSVQKIARYAVACGFLEQRGALAKVRSLIANGYLQYGRGSSKLFLTPATRRILLREFPAMNGAAGMDDQTPP